MPTKSTKSETIQLAYEIKRNELLTRCEKAGAFPLQVADNCEGLDKQIFTAWEIEQLYLKYQVKQNPLYMMEAFEAAFFEAFSIPTWVQHDLSLAFRVYRLSGGQISLDEILKITGRGKRGPPQKRIEVEDRERNLARQIATLRIIGFPLALACSLVSFVGGIGYHRAEEIYKIYRNTEGKDPFFILLDWPCSHEEMADFIINEGFLYPNGWKEKAEPKHLKKYKQTLQTLAAELENAGGENPTS